MEHGFDDPVRFARGEDGIRGPGVIRPPGGKFIENFHLVNAEDDGISTVNDRVNLGIAREGVRDVNERRLWLGLGEIVDIRGCNPFTPVLESCVLAALTLEMACHPAGQG